MKNYREVGWILLFIYFKTHSCIICYKICL